MSDPVDPQPPIHSDQMEEDQIPHPQPTQDDDSDSDLSEVDEALLEHDLDNEIQLSREILDANDLKKISVHRRAASPSTAAPAQPKQQKRRKRARSEDVDLNDEGVGIVPDKQRRKGSTVQREKKVREVTPDHLLSSEELRKREFDRRFADAIGKKQKKKKKKDGMDIESQEDERITVIRQKMIDAADLDWTNNTHGRTAIAKLQLLPLVKPVLHNPSLSNSCLDNSLLDAVRKWLEPLPQPAPKGSLPAYDIQKEMFRWLESIHPTTDILRESGIGKVVLFYTKDVRPQLAIKRQAENLMREWARPILGRSADYRTKTYATKTVDLDEVYTRPSGQSAANEDLTHHTNPMLAPPVRNQNRTRIPVSMPKTYEIVPVNNVSGSLDVRKNQAGDDIIKKIKQRQINERKGRKSTLKLS